MKFPNDAESNSTKQQQNNSPLPSLSPPSPSSSPPLRPIHDYLVRTLTTPYPPSDPIYHLFTGPSADGTSTSTSTSSGSCVRSSATAITPALLAARPHDILRLAWDKLHTWPYKAVPVCWRRVVIECVLWCCVGLLEEREEKENEDENEKEKEKEKENEDKRIKEKDGKRTVKEEKARIINVSNVSAAEKTKDWVAEFVRMLDEGVIVSGAPGREGVVERVLGMLDLQLQTQQQQQQLEGKRKREREREREREDSGGDHDSDDSDMDVERESKRKRRRVGGSGSESGNYRSEEYIYPPHINPLPLTFSTCDDSSSVPSVSIPIKYPIPRCDTPSLAAFEAHIRGVIGTITTDRAAGTAGTTGVGAIGRKIDGHSDIDFPSPLVLTSTIAHWPAICDPTRSWDSPRYLLSRALGGRRLVPVEVGRSYVDDGWGQKIVPFGEFMGMLLSDNDNEDDDNGNAVSYNEEKGFNEIESRININGDMKNKRSKNSVSLNASEDLTKGTEQATSMELGIKRMKKKNRQKWYLAQHDLFTQMPALRADIAIPEYCYLSSTPTPLTSPDASPTTESYKRTSSPSSSLPSPPPQIHLNAWLGPAGTISPLHTDPHHNILAQVVGRKYVRLYAPSDTRRVYPRGVDSSTSTSNSKRRKTKKEYNEMHVSENENDEDDDDDDDEHDDEGATTPHQSANTSYVDVGDVLPWTWELEREAKAGFGSGSGAESANAGTHANVNMNNSSSNSSNATDGDDPLAQSLQRQQQHQQRQQQRQALQNIRNKYPLFIDAPYLETVLEPGECLFIPRSWWHYVRSLSTSFSVSFWWD